MKKKIPTVGQPGYKSERAKVEEFYARRKQQKKQVAKQKPKEKSWLQKYGQGLKNLVGIYTQQSPVYKTLRKK